MFVTNTPPNSSPPRTADWLTPGRFGGFLALLIFVAYPDVVTGAGTFFFRDFGFFGYPLAYYHKASFWRGEIPLWNPLSSCGLPFLAQWNTLVLYPGSLIYLLLPLSWSLGMFCLAHQWLGGVGMFWLARRWTGSTTGAAVAGTGYAFGGLLLNSLMWPNNIAALGLLPWVLGWVERGWREGGKALLIATLIGAAQMLSGAPEVILFAWLVAGTLWAVALVAERGESSVRIRRFCLMVLWVTGICAAQLLPFLDLLAHSQRDNSYGNADWSMPMWGWANFLVPTFRCFTKFFGVIAQHEQYWTSSYYAGIGVLALAGIAVARAREPRVRTLAALAVVSLVLALGDHGYLFPTLKMVAPQLGFLRYPVKFITVTVVCLPLLAAFGARWLLDTGIPTSSARGAAKVSFGVVVWLVAVIACLDWQNPIFRPAPFPVWPNGLTRAALLLIMLGGLLAARQRFEGPRERGLIIALILVFSLDGLSHVPLQNPTMPRSGYTPGLVKLSPQPIFGAGRAMVHPAAAARMHQFAAPDPLTDYVASRAGLFMNCNLIDEIAKPDGFFSLYLRRPERVERVILNGATNLPPERGPLLDYLGVTQITAPETLFEWQRRTNAMPLVTAGQRVEYLDGDAAFYRLGTADFDPRNAVWLPPEAKAKVGAITNTTARVTMIKLRAQELTFTVDTPAPTAASIAQAYSPRWRAFVDGSRTRLWQANYAFQALVVPAGHHEVIVAYVDWPFRMGAVISLGSLAAWVFFFTAETRRRGEND
ncbi:MAG TPA: hypothetical protein VHH73_01955 [Verrucomicrobiae bacterium]|nr:hypothetical protein [Verrucomicrobiae bacterium]